MCKHAKFAIMRGLQQKAVPFVLETAAGDLSFIIFTNKRRNDEPPAEVRRSPSRRAVGIEF